jgi:hypothetical protein
MPDDTGSRELTVEEAVPAFAALLFPDSPSDTTEPGEPPAESEAPAEDDAEPDAEAQAAEEESEALEAQAEGESEEPSEDAPDEPPQPRRLRVKIDDAEEEVTEDELVKGYQRQSDYTRKTMTLAEERKAFEAEAVAVRAERQQYATYLSQLADALKPESPDWDAIRREQPEQFPALFAEWQVREEQHRTVQAERERAEAKVREDRAQELRQMLAAERAKLLQAMPEFQDEATAKSVAEYLKGVGFSEQDIAGAARHELLVMARKAQLYDEAQKVKPKIEKKVEEKIRPAKPGSTAAKPRKTEAEREIERLRRTGNLRDAAKLFERIL